MSLPDGIPQALRVELYADTDAALVLRESETVTNRFRCVKSGDAFDVYAENNSDVDRRYTVVIYSGGKEYKAAQTAAAGTVMQASARL